jgi:hypothetical protein
VPVSGCPADEEKRKERNVHFGLEDDTAGGFIDRERTRVSSIGKTKLQSW